MVDEPQSTGWSSEDTRLAECTANQEPVPPDGGPGQPSQGAWYRRFFDSCRHMMFISGQDGRLIDVNPAGVALFGFASKEEMLRLPSVAELYREPGDREWFQRALEEQGYVKDYEVEMLRKDGTIIIASLTTNVWRDERGAVLYEGTLRDLTERRRWLNVMKKINERNQMLTFCICSCWCPTTSAGRWWPWRLL
jgi:PAS domain S-box-containing protein